MIARLPLLAAVFVGAILSGRAQDVSIEKVEGQARFVIESDAVSDLSGLTWTGGDAFCAVADHPNLLVPLTLQIDGATGRIVRGEVGTPITVPAPVGDFEGVTYVSATKTFYIAAEYRNTVISFPPGGPARPWPVPEIYAQALTNLGLESITWNDTAGHFWIANEEALRPDGPVSGAVGTLVRLQRFDAKFQPAGQFAWRTEPAAFRFRNSGNGVADLCLLPDGRLIVLERGFGFGGLQVRLFLADFTGATDVAKLPALAKADFTPVGKTLLFSEATGFINFEGLALGPMLDDGCRSLIALADSNDRKVHTFLPLKIRIGSPAASVDGGGGVPAARGASRQSRSR